MKKFLLVFLISFFLFAITLNKIHSQVRIGTSEYTTLKAAFDKINDGTHKGNVVIKIEGSTTETASAVLYQSGYGSANYTSVKIYPTGTDYSIKGNINGALIDLNGTDNVIIDGRVNETGLTQSLTIENTVYGSGTDAVTIQFQNSAEKNTIRYCTIKGAAYSRGVLTLQPTSTGNGCDDNLITRCRFTNSSGNRPRCAVYLTNGTKDNDRLTVSDNYFYDLFSTVSTQPYVIDFRGTNSENLKVLNNSIYESSSITPASGADLRCVSVDSKSAEISGNYIGGQSAMCGGEQMTISSVTPGDFKFSGIYINVSTKASSQIQGNVIRNIKVFNTYNTFPFKGIALNAGIAYVGTSTGNIVGSVTGTGSVQVGAHDNNSVKPVSYGIYAAGGYSSFYEVANNSVGSVNCSVTNTSSTNGHAHSFVALYMSAYGYCSNNLIGSLSTAKSIECSSDATKEQYLTGIYCMIDNINASGNSIANLHNNTTINTVNSQVTGIHVYGTSGNTVSGNLIRNLSNSCGQSSSGSTASVIGINHNAAYIHGNTLKDLTNTNPTNVSVQVYGIHGGAGSTSQELVVKNNFISGLNIHPDNNGTSEIRGISIVSYGGKYFNNIVGLSGINKDIYVYGIYDPGNSNEVSKLWYNSVYLGGSISYGNATSAALFRSGVNGTSEYKNNILVNARSRASGDGTHYAIIIAGFSSLSMDYNCYYVSGTGGVLGKYSITNVTGLPIVPGKDANSQNTNPNFSSPGGSSPGNYLPSTSLTGTSISDVPFDYYGTVRGTSPQMGAMELIQSNPVKVYKNNTLQASYTTLGAAFDNISNGTHNGRLTIKLTGNIAEPGNAVLKGSGTGGTNYSSVLIYPTVSGVEITGDYGGSGLIDLNGADSVTIDGRVNQTGSRNLTIKNINTSSYGTSTICFRNGAEKNRVLYCNLKGSSRSTESGGIVHFGRTNSDNGNNDNLIDNCTLTQAGNSPPRNGVFSDGDFSKFNLRNVISNNNFFDFLPGTIFVNVYPVYLFDNNSEWVIRGNSFYETTTHNCTNNLDYIGIYVYKNNNFGKGFSISGNYLGGNAPQCSGRMIFGDTLSTYYKATYKGIMIYSDTTAESVIRDNTIKNITLRGTASIEVFTGIRAVDGKIRIAGNTIGEATGTGSLRIGLRYIQEVVGIKIADVLGTTQRVSENTISSIEVFEESSSFPSGVTISLIHSYMANYAYTPRLYITDNVLGGETSNSVRIPALSRRSELYGIYGAQYGTDTIAGNKIMNLTVDCTRDDVRLAGIYIYGTYQQGNHCIKDNQIRDLKTAGTTAWPADQALLAGISLTSTGQNQSITNNKIAKLTSTYSSNAPVCVYGIFFCNASPSTDRNNLINRNYISELKLHSSNNGTAIIAGIYTPDGTSTYANNVISLTGINNDIKVRGILDECYRGNNNFYFNTVYLSGTVSNSNAYSAAYMNTSTQNTRTIKNNIFVNERSRQAGSGKHYAIWLKGSTGLTLAYNDYYVNGTGTVLAFDGANDKSSPPIIAGQDGGSVKTNPSFQVTGGVYASDYRPSASLAGTSISGITTDHFLLPRSLNTMGAIDNGNPFWTGSLGTTWNLAGNWSNGIVPTSTTNALIPAGKANYPLVGNAATVKDLSLETGGSVRVSPANSLTVNGILTNNTGTSGIVVKSSSSGTGSLIHSTKEVLGTVERYIGAADLSVAGDGWHFLSSPVPLAAVNGDWTPSGTNDDYDLYTWKESTNTWMNHKLAENRIIEFQKGMGYLAAYQVAETKSVKGPVNVESVSIMGLKNTPETTKGGWNLLGNPFCSALKWNDGNWNLTNIAGTAKIWNEENRSYSDVNANEYIPLMNGFMVQVSSGNGLLTMPASSREHNTTSWYKSAGNRIMLLASESDGSYAQESQILVNRDASPDFDFSFDSRFLASNAPQFYSYVGEEMVSTNAFPELTDDMKIPFAFSGNGSENFKIILKENSSGKTIYLFDKLTGKYNNLSLMTSYNFHSDLNDDTDRFILTFKPEGIQESCNNQLQTYYSDGKICFRVVNGTGTIHAELYDMNGRSCFRTTTPGSGWQSFTCTLPAGLYLLKVTCDTGILSSKVLIH